MVVQYEQFFTSKARDMSYFRGSFVVFASANGTIQSVSATRLDFWYTGTLLNRPAQVPEATNYIYVCMYCQYVDVKSIYSYSDCISVGNVYLKPPKKRAVQREDDELFHNQILWRRQLENDWFFAVTCRSPPPHPRHS
jgi:hypothetical protein